MTIIDVIVLAVYITARTPPDLAGPDPKVEGVFPCRERYSRLGGHDLDCGDRDQYGDLSERAGRGYRVTSPFCNWLLATCWGGWWLRPFSCLPIFEARSYRLSTVQDRFGGPTRTTASVFFLVARSWETASGSFSRRLCFST